MPANVSALVVTSLADVSHDLRTPLNVVVGYIDLLLDHSFGCLDPGQREVLARIMGNASHVSKLIDRVVELSRTGAAALD